MPLAPVPIMTIILMPMMTIPVVADSTEVLHRTNAVAFVVCRQVDAVEDEYLMAVFVVCRQVGAVQDEYLMAVFVVCRQVGAVQDKCCGGEQLMAVFVVCRQVGAVQDEQLTAVFVVCRQVLCRPRAQRQPCMTTATDCLTGLQV